MDIIELRDNYIASLKADKAQTTIEGYARTINLFLAWAGDKNAKLNTATIMGWRSHLAEEGDGVTTISLYMQHMRYWCEYISAIQEGFVMPDFGILNPDKRRVSVAKKKPYKHVLGPSEVIAILSADRPSKCSTETWPRNKAILTLFLTGSMRNAELCSIRPCDLDWASHQILLENTKGGMPRYAAFPAVAQKAVTEYLESGYRPKTLKDTDPLFVSYPQGTPFCWGAFDRDVLSSLVMRLVRLITGIDGIRSHALRHASASFMLTHDVPLDEIQQALGHSNINTTMRYAQRIVNKGEVRKSVFDAIAAV